MKHLPQPIMNMILLELTLREILNAMLTAREWHAAIARNKMLCDYIQNHHDTESIHVQFNAYAAEQILRTEKFGSSHERVFHNHIDNTDKISRKYIQVLDHLYRGRIIHMKYLLTEKHPELFNYMLENHAADLTVPNLLQFSNSPYYFEQIYRVLPKSAMKNNKRERNDKFAVLNHLCGYGCVEVLEFFIREKRIDFPANIGQYFMTAICICNPQIIDFMRPYIKLLEPLNFPLGCSKCPHDYDLCDCDQLEDLTDDYLPFIEIFAEYKLFKHDQIIDLIVATTSKKIMNLIIDYFGINECINTLSRDFSILLFDCLIERGNRDFNNDFNNDIFDFSEIFDDIRYKSVLIYLLENRAESFIIEQITKYFDAIRGNVLRIILQYIPDLFDKIKLN